MIAELDLNEFDDGLDCSPLDQLVFNGFYPAISFKPMENFDKWPNWIKISLGLIVTALIAAGLRATGIKDFSNLNSQLTPDNNVASSLNIDFIVQTEQGDPIEGVEVTFISKGAPEVKRTNTSGFVQLQIPSRDDIDVRLSKIGFKTSTYTINLKNDPQRTRNFQLKKEAAKK